MNRLRKRSVARPLLGWCRTNPFMPVGIRVGNQGDVVGYGIDFATADQVGPGLHGKLGAWPAAIRSASRQRRTGDKKRRSQRPECIQGEERRNRGRDREKENRFGGQRTADERPGAVSLRHDAPAQATAKPTAMGMPPNSPTTTGGHPDLLEEHSGATKALATITVMAKQTAAARRRPRTRAQHAKASRHPTVPASARPSGSRSRQKQIAARIAMAMNRRIVNRKRGSFMDVHRLSDVDNKL